VDRLEPHRLTVIEAIEPIESDPIDLPRAGGRVLARAALARRAAPPFTCSAMDGYAVRHADVASPPAEHPHRHGVQRGENVRLAGEDVAEGAEALAEALVRISEGAGDLPEGERVETWLLGE